MSLPAEVVALARAQRQRQQVLSAQLARLAGAQWRRLDPEHVVASWVGIARTVYALTIAAIAQATRGAEAYVATAVRMQGGTPDPAGAVSMAPMVGAASDGRPLAGLLEAPVYSALDLMSAGIGLGLPPDEAAMRGGALLTRILTTQVQDASRVAVGVAQVNDRAVAGYIRYLTPPSCSRCVILAGKWYRYNAGFDRHPHCDCIGMPAPEVIEPQSPRKLFDAMSDSELKKAGWTDGDVQAIRDGADISQVTNAHQGLRSMTVAGRTVRTTTTGTTRRSLAGRRLVAARGKQAIRLTPEQIYADAERLGLTRDELIRQLTRNGYIL